MDASPVNKVCHLEQQHMNLILSKSSSNGKEKMNSSHYAIMLKSGVTRKGRTTLCTILAATGVEPSNRGERVCVTSKHKDRKNVDKSVLLASWPDCISQVLHRVQNMSSPLERKALITRKDLHNIMANYGLKKKCDKMNQNDSMHVPSDEKTGFVQSQHDVLMAEADLHLNSTHSSLESESANTSKARTSTGASSELLLKLNMVGVEDKANKNKLHGVINFAELCTEDGRSCVVYKQKLQLPANKFDEMLQTPDRQGFYICVFAYSDPGRVGHLTPTREASMEDTEDDDEDGHPPVVIR
ncbi:unnamed protein product [Darwinula stevensoni]|uniref:Uncharacterized protein n=1 Tax=Darwinula stevensoni TaxID=69355 RepID=A0A7R8XAS5_9CRUS|nr:unnamed protein product [Darwinula stevensoni]CAG0890567.1 unnamed protein product [Darwinula stevensoni]